MSADITEERRYKQYKKVVEKHFWETLKKKIDWRNPQTYNEKLQIIKLDPRTEELWKYVDKLEVRSFVKDIIGNKYLVPLISTFEAPEDINLKTLPKTFVLKATHGSAWNIICSDKKTLNIDEVKTKLTNWMKLNYCDDFGKERQYRKIIPRIICEENLSVNNQSLPDYKFFCFNGVPKFVQVDLDRYQNHTRNYYDLSWNLLPYTYNYPNYSKKVDKPKSLKQMLNIAIKLCKNFRHVRVDLYNIDGKIYFSELTFTPENGMGKFDPIDIDFLWGTYLNI